MFGLSGPPLATGSPVNPCWGRVSANGYRTRGGVLHDLDLLQLRYPSKACALSSLEAGRQGLGANLGGGPPKRRSIGWARAMSPRAMTMPRAEACTR